MAVNSGYRFPSTLGSLSIPPEKPFRLPQYLRPNSFQPITAPNPNPSLRLFRPTISDASAIGPRWVRCIPAVHCKVDDEAATEPEAEPNDSDKSAVIDIKLPRRSLLVQFTCNACGERTKRLVNRLAYERGLIFVQCAGCLQHHKLVDNLGLITEYDFQEKTD